MRRDALRLLADPHSGAPLALHHVASEADGEILDGVLRSADGAHQYPIRQHIPRFVERAGELGSFGYQWRQFRRTQLDRFNRTRLTHERFYRGTGWTPDDLRGHTVLEAGCGAGRFTEVLLEAGASVYAFDGSEAADVCWANLGPHPRLCVAQARLEQPPFQPACFDKVFCYGVLQHTADPGAVFRSLLRFLKPGGAVAVDLYRRTWRPHRWNAKYFWRPLTKRLPPAWLFKAVGWYVPRWMRVEQAVPIPKLRSALASVVPCWNYRGMLELPNAELTEWAVLDTFDALSAWHDHPQCLATVRGWCEEAGLEAIQVAVGGNGIIATARKPK